MPWPLILVFVASFVLSALIRPKPETKKPSPLDQSKVPTAEIGTKIPVLFGTRDITSPNVVWFGNVRTTPVKKKAKKK